MDDCLTRLARSVRMGARRDWDRVDAAAAGRPDALRLDLDQASLHHGA